VHEEILNAENGVRQEIIKFQNAFFLGRFWNLG